jgi:hypothetical protein
MRRAIKPELPQDPTLLDRVEFCEWVFSNIIFIDAVNPRWLAS